MRLPPYPNCKESGLHWLGRIPAHWRLLRNGCLFSQRSETGFGELPILEVSLKTGVRVRDMNNPKRKQMMTDREKYKRAAKGDLAYNMMRMWQGAAGIAPVDGLVSPAYVVASPRPETECRYFAYLFRTAACMNEVDACSRGIVKDRNRLYWQDFKRMPSPVPPPDEQVQIVRFLNWKSSQADKFIRIKRRTVELLKEQKRSLINHAVTRGLDPNAGLKPSGVEWIGDIPEHWKVRRLKMLARNITEQASAKKADDIYIALEHVESWSGRLLLPEKAVAFDSQVKQFQPNDVLFGKLRPYLAKVVRPQVAGVCVGEFLVLRVLVGEAAAEFLECKLRSKCMIDQISSSSSGVKMPRTEWTSIGNLAFSHPPVDEQHAIVSRLREQVASIDLAIARAERAAALVREYRDRLIADVVFGKVDVRGIAVPEAAEDDCPAPEDEEDFDDEMAEAMEDEE